MSLNMSLLYEESARRTMTQAFYGLNKNLRSAEGEFFDMKNLTSDEAPVMAVRERRYLPSWGASDPTDVVSGVGAAYSDDGICRVDGICWIDGTKLKIGTAKSVDLSEFGFKKGDTNRSIVKLGAYLIIVPDMIYVNTVDTEDKGVIKDSIVDSVNTYTMYVCDDEGNIPEFTQEQEPEEAEKGDLWHETGDSPALRRYNKETDEWYEVVSYIRISTSYYVESIPAWQPKQFTFEKPLLAGDAIQIKDLHDAVNGRRQVAKVQDSWSDEKSVSAIYVQGILNQEYIEVTATKQKPVTIERVIPKLDYVCEAGNRLWGCRYGDDGYGNFVNEIYCSARGDFFRWIQGEATNEDAPVTFSVGTDGAWTGCINYGGYPTFFKKNSIHRVSGYGASGFALQEAPCMGVQSGAERSLAVVNNVLYYKADHCIMAYDGTVPVNVSEKLGRLSVYNRAVGGACGGKYYVSMWMRREFGSTEKEDKNPVLMVLDTEKGIWHKEDETECESMASDGDNMYFVETIRRGSVENPTVTHAIKAVKPPEDLNNPLWGQASIDAKKESAMIPWYAETGVIGLESPDSKYISRLTIRLQLDAGASVRVLVQYDSSGYWKQIGGTEAPTMRTVSMPVVPMRCDHMRLRLEGVGGCKVNSITKTLESGEEA